MSSRGLTIAVIFLACAVSKVSAFAHCTQVTDTACTSGCASTTAMTLTETANSMECLMLTVHNVNGIDFSFTSSQDFGVCVMQDKTQATSQSPECVLEGVISQDKPSTKGVISATQTLTAAHLPSGKDFYLLVRPKQLGAMTITWDVTADQTISTDEGCAFGNSGCEGQERSCCLACKKKDRKYNNACSLHNFQVTDPKCECVDTGLPGWAIGAVVASCVVAVGGIVFAAILIRRGRKAQADKNILAAAKSHTNHL